jgi:hypothetical protein
MELRDVERKRLHISERQTELPLDVNQNCGVQRRGGSLRATPRVKLLLAPIIATSNTSSGYIPSLVERAL